ncbi:MAG: trigger factor [Bacteroidales bacterium]|jgi:trigger factor|nr:trigger factor [Bacteroidales bacterium]
MNIVKNQIDELNIQLTVTVAHDDYAEAEKKELQRCKRTAEFKGFRKGMVPMSLIERVYGERVLGEVVNKVLSDAINNFVKENNIKMVGEALPSEDQPEIEWKSGNDFTFKFDIATTSEVNFELSKDDKVKVYEIKVSAEAKKEMKDNLLRQFGSLTDAEQAGEDDFVIVDFAQEGKTVEGSYVGVKNVEGEAKSKFLGAKVGDQFDVNVNEAFTNESDRAYMLKVKKEELASLAPEFHVTVKEVKTFAPAEENQETYDKIFGENQVHNAEEFDKAVTARLEENYKQESDYKLSKDLREYLVKKADIKLPEEFLKRWLFNINDGKFSKEEIEKEAPAFFEDFRWQMVRGYIMQKFDLKIEEKDVHEAAQAYVAYQYASYGMGNVPEAILKDSVARVLQDENTSRRIVENVEATKVIEAVKGAVTLKAEKVSVEDFRTL